MKIKKRERDRKKHKFRKCKKCITHKTHRNRNGKCMKIDKNRKLRRTRKTNIKKTKWKGKQKRKYKLFPTVDTRLVAAADVSEWVSQLAVMSVTQSVSHVSQPVSVSCRWELMNHMSCQSARRVCQSVNGWRCGIFLAASLHSPTCTASTPRVSKQPPRSLLTIHGQLSAGSINLLQPRDLWASPWFPPLRYVTWGYNSMRRIDFQNACHVSVPYSRGVPVQAACR